MKITRLHAAELNLQAIELQNKAQKMADAARITIPSDLNLSGEQEVPSVDELAQRIQQRVAAIEKVAPQMDGEDTAEVRGATMWVCLAYLAQARDYILLAAHAEQGDAH